MTKVNYLPLTRIVKAERDGLPLSKLEEHYHVTIHSCSIRLVFRDDYMLQILGYFGEVFYNTWTTVFSDINQQVAINAFCDHVNYLCYVTGSKHGKRYAIGYDDV